MDPFDWTKHKSIYQRWQLWSEKARLTLDAMEGDSEKTKISYFHHWINGERMGHIESWKNSKTLISQSAYDELESTEGKYSSECIESYFTLFELLLAPKSNPLLAVEELHFTKQGSMTSRAHVNCMNEKTFKRLFPKVTLSVCPHEIQNFGNSVQTFLYWDSFTPTCSLERKSILILLLSPMPMTAPIYSAMEQPSEWVYYFLTTQRRML